MSWGDKKGFKNSGSLVKGFAKQRPVNRKTIQNPLVSFAPKSVRKLTRTSNNHIPHATTMELGHCSTSAARTEGVGKLLIKYACYCSLYLILQNGV